MIPERRRYFIHVAGFPGDTSHIMIDGAGVYWICYKGNKPATCEPGAGLDVALRYVQQGVWKEITREEAIMNTSPKSVVLKPEEIKVGMTIIGYSTFDESRDRSYIGTELVVTDIQLPFVFAKYTKNTIGLKDVSTTVDTRRYFFMERAGSKPAVDWEAKYKELERTYLHLDNVRIELLAEQTRLRGLVQKWCKNSFTLQAEVVRIADQLVKANHELEKLTTIKKMFEDPNVIHIALKLK